jgi:hypothetical protein
MLKDAAALILAMLTHFAPGMSRYADRSVVVGLASAASDPALHMTREELAIEVVYGAFEGQFRDHPPHAYSWDAKSGVSCGFLQERCWYTKDHSDEEQATWWLHNERAAGLASVDSSPTRAAQRTRLAHRILKGVEDCPWHAALLAKVFPPSEDGDAMTASLGE